MVVRVGQKNTFVLDPFELMLNGLFGLDRGKIKISALHDHFERLPIVFFSFPIYIHLENNHFIMVIEFFVLIIIEIFNNAYNELFGVMLFHIQYICKQ